MPVPPRQALAAVLAAAAAVLVCASAAQAVPPTTETLHDEGIVTLPDSDCGSFALHEEMISEDITVTTFYDQQGNVDHLQLHISFLGEITNSATGETFRDHIALSVVVEGDIGAASGIAFNLVRQGQGAVLQLIGRRFEDAEGNLVFVQGGPNDIEGGLEPAICAALA